MKKNQEESIDIYWAPVYIRSIDNLIYQEPSNLYFDFLPQKSKESGPASFFNCPAVTDRMKKTFVFKNNLDTEFYYDFNDIKNPIINPISGIHVEFYKHSNILDGASIALDLYWIFFAEENVELYFNPPYYHKPTDFSSKGYFPSAKIEANKWFRPYSAEIQMWENSGNVKINEGDPLFYLEVMTNKKVNLKRFDMNAKLIDIMNSCVNSPHKHGARLPLEDRYKRFIETKTNKIVIKEIKSQLLDE
jgi:hypothetical protein